MSAWIDRTFSVLASKASLCTLTIGSLSTYITRVFGRDRHHPLAVLPVGLVMVLAPQRPVVDPGGVGLRDFDAGDLGHAVSSVLAGTSA
jgi:hypothetical protein